MASDKHRDVYTLVLTDLIGLHRVTPPAANRRIRPGPSFLVFLLATRDIRKRTTGPGPAHHELMLSQFALNDYTSKIVVNLFPLSPKGASLSVRRLITIHVKFPIY